MHALIASPGAAIENALGFIYRTAVAGALQIEQHTHPSKQSTFVARISIQMLHTIVAH